MPSLFRLLAVIISLAIPAISFAQKAEMPVPTDFHVGDTWEWRQTDDRTKLEEGRFTRAVTDDDGIPKFSYGRGTAGKVGRAQISAAFIGLPAAKPWRVWPLEVGKKWAYDGDWQSESGGFSGNTKQDAEVVSYEQVTVPAGTFMAFKIEHKGWFRNSLGTSGRANDTYWYAPDVKADVKITKNDGYNLYTRELVSYKRGAP